jgi:heme exporter protein C
MVTANLSDQKLRPARIWTPARGAWLIATLALLGYGLHVALQVVPTEATMGNVQRIFYYHLPSAFLAFLFFFLNFAASAMYLIDRRSRPQRAQAEDAFAVAAAEIGVIFCTVVLVTGPLWARPVWGIWWTWDARLTSTLVLWLIYASYLLLRNFAAGPQMQTLAAVLAIFGWFDVPIVYMSTRWWRTQHPAPVIGGGQGSGLDASMWPAVLWNLAAWLAWGLLVLSIRYTVERRRQRIEMAAALRAIEG